ncbi:MAG: MFS transporter [Clostridia bacterium]
MQNFIGRMRYLYANRTPCSPEEKGRLFFAFGEAGMTTVDQLASGVYIASLMVYLGMSDAGIGTIISFASLANAFQLFALRFSFLCKNKKRIASLFAFQRIWTALFFLLPLLPLGAPVKIILMTAGYLVSKILIALGTPALFGWLSELVPVHIRGAYLGMKDAIIVGTMALVLLYSGFVLDWYPGAQAPTAFCILAVLAALFSLGGLFCYASVRGEKDPSAARQGAPALLGLRGEKSRTPAAPRAVRSLRAQFKFCFAQQNFTKMLLLDCLWLFTYSVAFPYNISYSFKELALPFGFLSVVGFAGNIGRMGASGLLGRVGDRIGMAKLLRLALTLFALHYLVWMLMTPGNANVLYLVMQLFSTFAWSFVGVSLFGVKLELMSANARTEQFAVLAGVSGAFGFLVSWLAGLFLSVMQAHPISLWGLALFPQQLLSALGVLSALGMAWFLKAAIEVKSSPKDPAFKRAA